LNQPKLTTKVVSILAIAIAGVIGLAIVANGSGSISRSQDPITSGKPIRIAVIPWVGASHFYIAEEKFFKQNGVDVELVKNTDYSENQNMYLDGEVDGLNEVFPDTIYHGSTGMPTKAVYVEDYSLTGDVIIGKQGNLTDLRGKVIGVEGVNSYAHLFVLKSLERAGLYEKDVQFRNIPASEIVEALEKGEIDAGYTWGTELAEAMSKGYTCLAKAEDVRGIITDVVSFRADIVESRPGDIQKIVKSLAEAREYIVNQHEEALELLSQSQGISKEEIEEGFKSIYLLGLQDNVVAMEDHSDYTSLYGSGALISQFYIDRGQMSTAPNFSEIIEPKFIKTISETDLKAGEK